MRIGILPYIENVTASYVELWDIILSEFDETIEWVQTSAIGIGSANGTSDFELLQTSVLDAFFDFWQISEYRQQYVNFSKPIRQTDIVIQLDSPVAIAQDTSRCADLRMYLNIKMSCDFSNILLSILPKQQQLQTVASNINTKYVFIIKVLQ